MSLLPMFAAIPPESKDFEGHSQHLDLTTTTSSICGSGFSNLFSPHKTVADKVRICSS